MIAIAAQPLTADPLAGESRPEPAVDEGGSSLLVAANTHTRFNNQTGVASSELRTPLESLIDQAEIPIHP